MIDLHTHTIASDGILSPKDLVKKAKEVGLSAIAITDHDQVAGIPEALKAGEEYAVEVVPGVELSTYWLAKNRKEFHILGYFIDWENKNLLESLLFFQKEREKRAKKVVKILTDLGYVCLWEDILSLAQGSIGKPHLAQAVLANPANRKKLMAVFGRIPEISPFIEEYLIAGKPAYVEKAGFSPKEAIDFIHQAGGIVTLAHPCFDLGMNDKSTLEALLDWGIEGLEAIYPYKNPQESRINADYFSNLARENNLLITGGSDYHGLDGVGAGLGFIEWGMKIENEILEKLKEALC